MAMLTRVRKPNGRQGWGWIGSAIPSACAAAAMMAAGCDDTSTEGKRKSVAEVSREPTAATPLATPVEEPRATFSTMTLDQARQKAAASTPEKVVLINFTATWCDFCKAMEKNAWADERVKKWIDEHAVAVRFDFDKDRSFAQEMAVDALPAVIIVRGKEELGRVTEQMKLEPAQLLAWLENTVK